MNSKRKELENLIADLYWALYIFAFSHVMDKSMVKYCWSSSFPCLFINSFLPPLNLKVCFSVSPWIMTYAIISSNPRLCFPPNFDKAHSFYHFLFSILVFGKRTTKWNLINDVNFRCIYLSYK